MEIVFYETELLYETTFNDRTLADDNSVLSVSDRVHLAGGIFLRLRSNGGSCYSFNCCI